MQIALINKETNKVENVIVAPTGANVYFPSPEYNSDYCGESVAIGWDYNPETKEFTPPVVNAE